MKSIQIRDTKGCRNNFPFMKKSGHIVKVPVCSQAKIISDNFR